MHGYTGTANEITQGEGISPRGPIRVPNTAKGRIEVAPRAVATLASRAALHTYGVVGMSSRRIRHGLSDVLPPGRHHEGVEVRSEGGELIIELFVVMEYGLRISEVGHNMMSSGEVHGRAQSGCSGGARQRERPWIAHRTRWRVRLPSH